MSTLSFCLGTLAVCYLLTEVYSEKRYPVWPFDFKWSFAGKLNETEYQCVRIIEPSQPLNHYWHDNYLCYKNKNQGYDDPGLTWSFSNPIEGLNCTKFWEPSDSEDFHDNYLCVPNGSPYNFKYSFMGCYKDLDCISVNEPGDPNYWFDNYLCNNRTGRFDEKYQMESACASYNNNYHRITSSFWLTATLVMYAYIYM